MAKARKTRQQKELADKRRFDSTPTLTYSLPDRKTSLSVNTTGTPLKTSITTEYSHVRKDLLYTLAITGIIVALLTVLWFFLN